MIIEKSAFYKTSINEKNIENINSGNSNANPTSLENEEISFLSIPRLIEDTCEKHKNELQAMPQLSDVIAVDKWARNEVRENAQKESSQFSVAN